MTARVVAWDRNIAVIAVPLAPKFHHEEVSSVGGSRFSDFALDRYGCVRLSVL